MKKISIFSKKKVSEAKEVSPQEPEETASYSDITLDPEYQLLLVKVQRGNWKDCEQLISKLDQKYPGDKKFLEFKNDFALQYTVVNEIDATEKVAKKRKLIRRIITIAIIFGTLAILGFGIWYGVTTYQNSYKSGQLQAKANQMKVLSDQVDFLLNSGQPEKAADILKEMKALDPNNPIIGQLTGKKDKILKIEGMYTDAVDKLNKGAYSDALTVLLEINTEYPGYKDVTQLIKTSNSQIELLQALSVGTDAYTGKNWKDAISNFEEVLSINPTYSDINFKTMLVNSYFNQITLLLDNTNTTYGDIDQAATYYSHAIAILPQANVSPDQDKLRQFASNLLESKYVQASHQLINDPSQTIDSVIQAFNYLSKASELNPQNIDLTTELGKMSLYQSGFQYYVNTYWQSAAQPFSTLMSVDANYPSGFTKQLLYETYINQANQVFSIGSYADAENIYKNAETLVSDKENLLNFYLVELNLASTMGKMGRYNEADTYYMNGLGAISYDVKLPKSSPVLKSLTDAKSLMVSGKYQDAFNAFSQILVGNPTFYITLKINARQGNCIGLIAAHYHSSVQAILAVNNLPQETLLGADQSLVIPVIQ